MAFCCMNCCWCECQWAYNTRFSLCELQCMEFSLRAPQTTDLIIGKWKREGSGERWCLRYFVSVKMRLSWWMMQLTMRLLYALLEQQKRLYYCWFALSNCNLNSTMVEKSRRNLSYVSRKQSQDAYLFFVSSVLIQMSFIVCSLHLGYCLDWICQSPLKRRLPVSRCCCLPLFLAHEVTGQHLTSWSCYPMHQCKLRLAVIEADGREGCWKAVGEETRGEDGAWVQMGSPLLSYLNAHPHHAHWANTGTCLRWLSVGYLY